MQWFRFAREPLIEVTDLHRAGEEVPLAGVAAKFEERLHLGFRLDAFWYHSLAGSATHADDCRHDRDVISAAVGLIETLDERPVDLDDVDGEPLQVTERREACRSRRAAR